MGSLFEAENGVGAKLFLAQQKRATGPKKIIDPPKFTTKKGWGGGANQRANAPAPA
jgi:hypothetical protein